MTVRKHLLSLMCAALPAGALAAPALEVPLLDAPNAVRADGVRTSLDYTLTRERLDRPPVTAWIGHHGGSLFLEFHVTGAAEGPAVVRDDLGLFESAAVEVFLSSSDDPAHGYYHFATNPAGSLFDEAVRDAGWSRDTVWDAPFSVEVIEPGAEDGWAVRMEIPLAVMRRPVADAPPHGAFPDGLHLQIGAAAISHGGEADVVAWAPTTTSFHTPGDFGRITLQGGLPTPGGAVSTGIEHGNGEVILRTALVGATDGAGSHTAVTSLRREDATPPELELLSATLTPSAPAAETRLSRDDLPGGTHLVTRLYNGEGMLLDQLVQDWFHTEMAPVSAVHERFGDVLPLRVYSPPSAPVENLRIVRPSDGEAVWTHRAAAGQTEVNVDAGGWEPGVYELQWSAGGGTESLPIAKVPPTPPLGPDDWAFWGYAPDAELLAEFSAFQELIATDRPLAGFIYGGSIDSTTGALSALNIGSIREWKKALPDADLHLMIDGQGSFDLLSDERVERIAEMIVGELMEEDAVAGLHLDLEPYRASQVRLTRALTRAGWLKPLSLAAGLATTIPREQWASLDFMVVMNYDLGTTPEIFAHRAEQNARAFVRAGHEAGRAVHIGIPVIATHHEYTMMVEAATGKIAGGDEEATMLPFLNPALEIITELRTDGEIGGAVGAPVLWGALSRSHHVGMRRYRYLPNTISGDVWGRLLDHDESRGGM